MTGQSPAPGRLRRKIVLGAAALYLATVLACWATLSWFADEADAWLPTLLLFGPRWVFALPAFVVLPVAIRYRYWAAAACAGAAAVLVAGPVTGLTVSPGALFRSADSPHIRVMTCNAGGPFTSTAELGRVVDRMMPDMVFLQETNGKVTAADFPSGWNVFQGPAGLVFASRFPVKPDGVHTSPDLGVARGLCRYTVETPVGAVSVVDIHLLTPRDGLTAVLATEGDAGDQMRHIIGRRDRASAQARDWVGWPDKPLIAAGDFNMPIESQIYRRDWAGLRNAFSDAGNGWGMTKFTRLFAVRIDHILFTPPWRCRTAWVGPDVGSDHRPVFADFDIGSDGP